MEYSVVLHEKNEDNTCRYILKIGKNPKKTLIVFGLNPSTADEKKADPTMKKVMGFAKKNNFDGVIMLNLYPQRESKPKKLHKEFKKNLMKENIRHIESILKDIPNPTILASWGNNIKSRKSFKECIEQIYELSKKYNSKWLEIGDLTKGGHPRHSLYAPYSLDFLEFDIEKYIKTLKI